MIEVREQTANVLDRFTLDRAVAGENGIAGV
jgi:hypothetical protein